MEIPDKLLYIERSFYVLKDLNTNLYLSLSEEYDFNPTSVTIIEPETYIGMTNLNSCTKFKTKAELREMYKTHFVLFENTVNYHKLFNEPPNFAIEEINISHPEPFKLDAEIERPQLINELGYVIVDANDGLFLNVKTTLDGDFSTAVNRKVTVTKVGNISKASIYDYLDNCLIDLESEIKPIEIALSTNKNKTAESKIGVYEIILREIKN